MSKLVSSLRTGSTVLVCALTIGCGLFWAAAAVAGQTVLTQKQVPITITKSGSYVLGGNLKVTDPTVDAIVVAANDVTIDLGGFTIEGPTRRETSNGSAIETAPDCCVNVVVKNGNIRGFFEGAAAAIHLTGGGGHRVENIHVSDAYGIAIYADGVVTHCQVTNSAYGIGVGEGSVVTDNVLYALTEVGIHTNTSGTVDGLTGGVTIARNTFNVANLGAICIHSRGANRIEGNTCYGGWGGLVLTDGANFYARNFIYGAVEPLVDAGPPNIDGGTIDPALSNVIVPMIP